MDSDRQFMELAVNMPAHDPQVGRRFANLPVLFDMVPALTLPTPSKDVDQVGCLFASGEHGTAGDNHGRDVQAQDGHEHSGTILSQLGMQTMASKGWAVAMISTESAMISRLGSDIFMLRDSWQVRHIRRWQEIPEGCRPQA